MFFEITWACADCEGTDHEFSGNQAGVVQVDKKNVSIKIDVSYPNDSTITPNGFQVTAWADGVPKVYEFIQ